MRFSIRDLLWATALVAMALGWWVSYRALDARRLKAVQQASNYRSVLEKTKDSHDRLSRRLSALNLSDPLYGVDWSILNEPLVEP